MAVKPPSTVSAPERADVALLRVDRLPVRQRAQRVVRVVVDDERARHAARSGGEDRVGERGERRERDRAETGVGVLVRDVFRRREEWVAAADDAQVAGRVGARRGW